MLRALGHNVLWSMSKKHRCCWFLLKAPPRALVSIHEVLHACGVAGMEAWDAELDMADSFFYYAEEDVWTGLRAASSVRGPSNRDSSFKNSVFANTKKSLEKVEVSVRTNKKT
ncbi:hypothetical protein Tco_0866756 [Tanacetum coccineum]